MYEVDGIGFENNEELTEYLRHSLNGVEVNILNASIRAIKGKKIHVELTFKEIVTNALI